MRPAGPLVVALVTHWLSAAVPPAVKWSQIHRQYTNEEEVNGSDTWQDVVGLIIGIGIIWVDSLTVQVDDP